VSSTPPNITTPDYTYLCPSCAYDIRGLNFDEEKATCPECGWKIDLALLRTVPQPVYPFLLSVGIPLAIFGVAVAIFIALRITSSVRGVSQRAENVWQTTFILLVLATLLAAVNIPPIAFARKNRARYRAIPRERGHLWFQGAMFLIGSVVLVFVVCFMVVKGLGI